MNHNLNMSISQTPTLNLNNSHLRFSAHAFHKINANFIIKSTMAYELHLGSTIDVIILWLNAPIYELCPCAIQLFNLQISVTMMCLLQARNMDYCYNELFRSESCKSDVSLSWLTKRSSSLLLNAEPTCRLGVIRGSIWSPFTYKKWKMNKLYSFERLWSMKEDAGVTCRVGEISRLHVPFHVNKITA